MNKCCFFLTFFDTYFCCFLYHQFQSIYDFINIKCSVVPRSEILRAMFGPVQHFLGPFEIFEGHIILSVKHNPLRFFFTKAEKKNGCHAFFQLSFEPIFTILWISYQIKSRNPYGKAVFVRISDEYAANILRTALFTVIVRYIFTSCREYPVNKVGLTKK